MRMEFCPGTTMFEHYTVRWIVICPFFLLHVVISSVRDVCEHSVLFKSFNNYVIIYLTYLYIYIIFFICPSNREIYLGRYYAPC
jgi:uncharacterized membrane protein